MTKISTEYLEDILSFSKITSNDNYIFLNYEGHGVYLNASYNFKSDELEDLDSNISGVKLTLTRQQEDVVALYLENHYHNLTELNEELNREYLEDLKFEQQRDLKNGL